MKPNYCFKFVLGVAASLAVPQVCSAGEPVRWHVALEGAHAVGAPQQSEYGWGGIGSLALEVPYLTVLGLEAKVAGLYLANGDAPKANGVATHGAGTALAAMLGLRLRPFAANGPGGFWVDLHGGYVRTGNLDRPGLDAHLGYDIRALHEGRLDIGPVIGYTHIFQLGNDLRPSDAHVLSLGIQLSLGAAHAVRPDADGDHVFDDEDACPAVFGVRTSDPKTNGCPRGDHDHDGVFDDEDACPSVAGIRTSDPKTNGCPRPDRDGDSVFDDEDACPEVAGVRTTDPKTNGCPHADRDLDGVFDDEDACPDVPGPRTGDPKTSGCPKAVGTIHVIEDRIEYDERIHFETDIAAVKWVSHPTIEKLANFITGTPDIREVDIVGHTDETGPEDYNVRLSGARAEAVKALLVKYGVAPERLVTRGDGFSHPRAIGHTERQWRENRRVEFFITRVRNASGNETQLAAPVQLEVK